MHGIVMTPPAAPNESIFFKNAYNPKGNFITVGNSPGFICAFAIPLPVIGIPSIDVHSNPKRMVTKTLCSVFETPVEGSSDLAKIIFPLRMLIQLRRNPLHGLAGTIYF
jgi:hypothetical protein